MPQTNGSFQWLAGTLAQVPADAVRHPSRNAPNFPETPEVLRVIVRRNGARFVRKEDDSEEDLHHHSFGHFGKKTAKPRGHALFVPSELQPGEWVMLEWVDRRTFSACARRATAEEVAARRAKGGDIIPAPAGGLVASGGQ